MLKKITILAAVIFALLTSSSANAAIDNTSKLREFNPFCWHRKDCYNVRKQFVSPGSNYTYQPNVIVPELEQGFIKDASVAPCVGGTGDDQWGRCLPAGQTKTEISFGGQDKFSNIGEFIVLMYKYLLTIASIVAVVMIIIAGAQWITSGGNSEAIGSAKKRIGGAIIGLFIAYMSYFVLNTINPALVNLRLPQVWLIKPQSLMPEFCEDIEGADTKKFLRATGKQGEPVTLEEELKEGKGFTWTKPKENPEFNCGSRFFVEGGGGSTCKGGSCIEQSSDNPEDQKTCFDEIGDRKNYICEHARVFGDITNSAPVKNCGALTRVLSLIPGGFISPWACPPHKYVELELVCRRESPLPDEDFEFGYFKHLNVDRYWIESKSSNVINNMVPRCDQYGGIKGFVAKFEMVTDKFFEFNEYHFIGKGGVWLGGGQNDNVEKNVYPNLYKIKKEYLLQLPDLLKGVRLDVDVADIPDTEENEEVSWNNRKYWEEGYK